jgi:type VI secretion system protein ImpB
MSEGQKFIRRNRPPRVHITYQDPYDAEKMIELPFVMGVMADLSGNASEVEKSPFAERKFVDIDMDNFDARMAGIKPAVSFRVNNKLSEGGENEKLGVKLTFEKMDDFSPAAVARQVPPLARLVEARRELANLQRYMDGKVAAEDQIRKLLRNPELMKSLRDTREAPPSVEDNESAGKAGDTDH